MEQQFVMLEETTGDEVAYLHRDIPEKVIDDVAMLGYSDKDRFDHLMESSPRTVARLQDHPAIQSAIQRGTCVLYGLHTTDSCFRVFHIEAQEK